MAQIKMLMSVTQQGGALLLAGQTYTLADDVAGELVFSGRATWSSTPPKDPTDFLSPVSGGGITAQAAAAYAASLTKPTTQLVCDWRRTLTLTGATITTAEFSPDGSAVASIPGDGATGANFCSSDLPANIDTAGIKSICVWARVAARSTALKGYTAVPLKLLVAPLAGFTNFITFTFQARADGKWHCYTLDPSYGVVTGTFVWGDITNGVVGKFRVRPSVDTGTSGVATLGSDPLQVGETVFYGGIHFGQRQKARAIVRFDDGLANLNRVKQANVLVPYVGASGVTVPAGSYTAKELCDHFGFSGAAFILTRHTHEGNGDSANFATVAELVALQSAGWDVCFQSHDNPRSTNTLGVRLLGINGAPMLASSTSVSWVAATGVFTNAGDNLIDSSSPGQGNPIVLVGTPPAPFDTSSTYWARASSATAFTLHASEADSLANTNSLKPSADGSGTFGYGWRGATTDGSAIVADFATGVARMKAWGFDGWKYYAANQGSIDQYTEQGVIAQGITHVYTTNKNARGSIIGRSTMIPTGFGLGTQIGMWPSLLTSMSAFQTDGSTTEAAARAYVQALVRDGGIGQNYHHAFTNANALYFLAYLDELKLRSDQGLVEVTTPSGLDALMSIASLDA